MNPEDFTASLKAAREDFKKIQGNPTDEDITLLFDFLTLLLLDIPCDAANATHNLVGLITSSLAYATGYTSYFHHPIRPQEYNPSIKDDATEVYRTHAEREWTSKKEDFGLFKAAKRGIKLFFTTIVNKTWYKELQDVDLYYTNITAAQLINHLRNKSGGLHVIDTIYLTTEIIGYYKDSAGIPEYINKLEEAQLKAKQSHLPITNEMLVAISNKDVLATGNLPCTTKSWEDRDATLKMWDLCKTNYSKAHNKLELRIRAAGYGDRFGSANLVHNQPHTPESNHKELTLLSQLDSALNNITSIDVNEKAVLIQLVANNTKLTDSNTTLTANNKQLTGEVKDLILNLKKKGGSPNGPHSRNDRF